MPYPGVLLFDELMSALGAGDLQTAFVGGSPKTFTTLRARENLIFQGLFDFCPIKANDELSVDFEGRNPHNLLCGQYFPGVGVLGYVALAVRDVLF